MKFRLLTLIIIFSVTAFTFRGIAVVKAKTNFDASATKDWIYIIKNKALKATDLFQMQNGVLKITDATTGYLRTKKVYKNFSLSVDWRWTKSLGNSGVLIHIQPADTIWPVCYQVQQKADAAGDIICMNGLWAKECTDTVKTTVPKMMPSNEKPLGEWNNMLLKCKNGKIEVYINGQLQNKVSELTVNKGFIGFQAEGKPMEFRNLIIK